MKKEILLVIKDIKIKKKEAIVIMELTIKNEEISIKMSYIGFAKLRITIAKLLNHDFAELYITLCKI